MRYSADYKRELRIVEKHSKPIAEPSMFHAPYVPLVKSQTIKDKQRVRDILGYWPSDTDMIAFAQFAHADADRAIACYIMTRDILTETHTGFK